MYWLCSATIWRHMECLLAHNAYTLCTTILGPCTRLCCVLIMSAFLCFDIETIYMNDCTFTLFLLPGALLKGYSHLIISASAAAISWPQRIGRLFLPVHFYGVPEYCRATSQCGSNDGNTPLNNPTCYPNVIYRKSRINWQLIIYPVVPCKCLRSV